MSGLVGSANAGEIGPSVSASSTIAGNGPTLAPSPAPTMNAPSPAPSTIVGSATADTSQAFDQKFKGTSLEGKWETIKTSAEKNGISPSLAAAVMAHETGNGSNVRGNNPGGIMDPATNWQKKKQFPTIDAGIDATVGTIAKNYNRAGGNIDRLADIYAPKGAANDKHGLNKDWLPGVKKQMAFFGN